MSAPLMNFAAGGVPIPGNQIPPAAINPVARNVVNLYPLGNVSPSIYRETRGRRQRLRPGRRPRRLSTRRRRISCSPATRSRAATTSTRSRSAAPTCPAIRRATTCRRTACSPRARASWRPSMTNAAPRHVAPPRVPLRSAAEPHPAERARLRLRIGERHRPGTAVLQRQRLHADWRGDHRARATTTQTTFEMGDGASWIAGRHLVKVGGELRHTVDRHVPGDRAERVLRLRRHVPDQQRRRQPAARRAGHLLPGARRLQPRRARCGTSAPTRRTSGGSAAG